MKKFLRHLFIPHSKNNHRAKILHHSSFLLIILTLLASTFFISKGIRSHPDILGVSYSITTDELLTLTNQQRAAHGNSPLTLSSDLSAAATAKAHDMFAKNYWAHFAPDGSTTPWMFIKAAGYDYTYAGENLAKGYTNSSDIVTAWMNSPTHRENLLNPQYKDIGFAVEEGNLVNEDVVLVVQMFGAHATAVEVPSSDGAAAQPQQVVGEFKIPVSPMPAASHPKVQSAASVPSAPIIAEKESHHALFDARVITKTAIIGILSLLIFSLILDLIIIEKKKVPRLVGHNLDHIILIALFLLFIILQKTGGIL